MLTGIFPPLTTPFLNDEISFEKLKSNIESYNQTKLAGYVVLGSNGESPFLSFEEKIRLIAAVKNYSSSDKIIIAGTGSESIKETIRLSNIAAQGGANYVLILTPSYYKSNMDKQAMIDYFTTVADGVKIPVILYNVPKFTGVNIEAETVAKLAEHVNICGIKNSNENLAHLSEIINNCPNSFNVLVGTASILYPGLLLGATGGIVALANIAPGECINIFELIKKGELDKAKSIQLNLIELNKAVTSKYGVPGVKAAMDLLGYFGGEPMKPLRKLNYEQLVDLKSILKKAGLIEEK
jgi:4-hydroxy-2-oxoglutarate aldolase